MKVVQINSTCNIGSTGKICYSISELLNKENIENYIFYSIGKCSSNNVYKFSNTFFLKINALASRILGNNGFNSYLSTRALIKKIDIIKPTIVHLHNLHSNDINLTLLLSYLRNNHIKVFYTFHDCWAFTGYCCHFESAKCYKWITGCHHCPLKHTSSWISDRSGKMWKRKKKALSNLDLTIITPSIWLSKLVKKSFLKDYPVVVINNGIDLNVFKPSASRFREQYNLRNKFLILGVAFGWGYKKGLDVFVELSKRLDKDRFCIVLIGTNTKIDSHFPREIISIHKTNNQAQLAEIYGACDLFVNPTREENYPTVNMESIACGTPVLTFNTGGSPEILTSKTGSVVERDDINGLEKEIMRIFKEKPFSKIDCIEHAKSFDMNDKFIKYIGLYHEQLKESI